VFDMASVRHRPRPTRIEFCERIEQENS